MIAITLDSNHSKIIVQFLHENIFKYILFKNFIKIFACS